MKTEKIFEDILKNDNWFLDSKMKGLANYAWKSELKTSFNSLKEKVINCKNEDLLIKSGLSANQLKFKMYVFNYYYNENFTKKVLSAINSILGSIASGFNLGEPIKEFRVKLSMKKEKIIMKAETNGSHVVLLGAGASRAAFLKGDASGKKLPVMDDLIDILGLKSLLENAGIGSSGNFESIYSSLKNNELKKEIEDKVFGYFNSLSLPSTATIYDYLLLSLRDKDVIFTFNWDPFLFDAYQRNNHVAQLPQIYFLHGNVRIGACEKCNNWGRKSEMCNICNENYTDVPLLYPVENKNYSETNQYTAIAWKKAQFWFAHAFTITIFGYSAPKSDQKAVELFKKAWLQKSKREYEYVEVIDILCADSLIARWKAFTPTLHLQTPSTFRESNLWRWPRRTCEAMSYSSRRGMPCKTFSLPETVDLKELQNAIEKIARDEDKKE